MGCKGVYITRTCFHDVLSKTAKHDARQTIKVQINHTGDNCYRRIGFHFEPRSEKTGLRGFPTRSDTNQAVQPQKMARGLKFRIKVVEGLYYPSSENKDADQLRGYREADLRLCFRI